MPDIDDVELQVKRLHLRPGDRIVVKVSGHLSAVELANIERQLGQFAPGVPSIVMEEGTDMAVLGPDDDEGEADV